MSVLRRLNYVISQRIAHFVTSGHLLRRDKTPSTVWARRSEICAIHSKEALIYLIISSFTARFLPVTVLDEQGDVVEVNQAWKAFCERNGLPGEYTSEGENYLTIAKQAGDEYGDSITTELRRLLNSQRNRFTVVSICHSPNQERWFRLYATAVSLGNDRYYLLVHQRLDRDPSSKGNSPSAVGDAPTRSPSYPDRNRLVIDALRTSTSDFHLTFRAWNYPVSLTPEEVIIFTPE